MITSLSHRAICKCRYTTLALFGTLGVILAGDGLTMQQQTLQTNEMRDEPKIIVLGASYAMAWAPPQIAQWKVLNRGIGGNQSFEMLARFESDVIEAEPEAVLLWGFINDIYRADPGELAKVKEQVLHNYKQMIEHATREGIEVVLATEVSIRQPKGFKNQVAAFVGDLLGKTSYQQTINRHVADVNASLTQYAQANGIILLDFNTALADESGQRHIQFASEDGSHLSEAAYEKLTEYTNDALSRFPKGN